nr:hybrid sensor histidine kinase/response regulator [Sphingomonas insulae]
MVSNLGAAPDAADFQLLADNLPVLCWMARADGYRVWYNRRWHDYCGSTPQQMEGFGWQSVHDPDQVDLVTGRIQASIRAGEPFEMVYPLRGADGVLRPFLTRITPLRDGSGRVVRWFGVNTEVGAQLQEETRRDATEQGLRDQASAEIVNGERIQLALAAGAILGTWVWDPPTDRFTVDEAFAVNFGLDPALGRTGISLAQVVETVHPDDQAGLAAAIEEAVQRGGRYAHQYRVRRADGQYYWLEANGHVEHAADGTALRFPGVLIDVEERRSLIEERDRAWAELRHLNETLEQRIETRTGELMQAEEALRQSQKMEAVGQLTGGLAHDFNNLLAGIAGSLDLMELRIGQGRLKDVEKYMTAAQGAAKRAAALTHRLLAFSRRQTLAPKVTDVNAMVSGMLDLIQRTVGPANLVEPALAVDAWAALVDPSQLENALLNLCINARDAMPDGGRITIETENRTIDPLTAKRLDMPEGDYLSLCVSDTGVGMAPEVITKAFDPFFTTKPLGEGTGLGLSMIYGFAKQSGGEVRIHSEIGKGTSVCVYLPRHAGEASSSEDRPSLRSPPAGEGETVLVVDDEATVRMLVSDVLRDLGYTAIEAADGAGGLQVLQSDARIDLLVTDVGLPGGMNGRQMADAARTNRPDLKVLFITGYAETAVISHGHLDASMSVLGKPFSLDTLAARIRELIVG